MAALSQDAAAELELDQRVAAFSRQLRCLVCQNETLADSHADLAVDLRREIRDQMRAGKSEAAIMVFLTDRYGDFIRYRPALKRVTYSLWFGPFVLLGAGLGALSRALLRHRPVTVPPPAADLTRARHRLLRRRREVSR